MRIRWKTIFLCFSAALMMSGSASAINAGQNPEDKIGLDYLIEVEATAYCNPNGNLTASGRPTVEGLTVAGAREWMGCTALIWLENEDGTLEWYGYREFTVTGGDYRIKNGTAIDLFFEDRDDCIQW